MPPELRDLLRRLPLSEGWQAPTIFIETAKIGGLSIELCGLWTRNAAGEVATGSAAAWDGSPVARAYFELLERTSILEAIASEAPEYPVLDARARPRGTAGRAVVFRETREPTQRYSRSNGVAASAKWSRACRAARLELFERDRVLRSWYGQLSPRRLRLRAGARPPLEQEYDLEAYAFDGDSDPGAPPPYIRGIFGFPRKPEAPMAWGFAADGSPETALLRAARECVQRLAFLWGEPLPQSEPELAPTAEYHQEFFLHPGRQARIRAWLAGEHAERLAIDLPPFSGATERFVDLTPPLLEGRFRVARALPAGELPLVFGRGHPALRRELPEELAVHPIA